MTRGPGPEERKRRNRLIFKLTGRWPQSVVDERLAESDRLFRQARREALNELPAQPTSRTSGITYEQYGDIYRGGTS